MRFLVSGNWSASIDTSYSWSKVTEIPIWSSFQKLTETSYWHSHFWVSFGLPSSSLFIIIKEWQRDIYEQTVGTCSLMISSAKNLYSMIYLQVFILLFIKFVSHFFVSCVVILSDIVLTRIWLLALPYHVHLQHCPTNHALFLSFISHIHPMS